MNLRELFSVCLLLSSMSVASQCFITAICWTVPWHNYCYAMCHYYAVLWLPRCWRKAPGTMYERVSSVYLTFSLTESYSHTAIPHCALLLLKLNVYIAGTDDQCWVFYWEDIFSSVWFFCLHLQIKIVNEEAYKKKFEEIVRLIDKMENECIPSVTLSRREVILHIPFRTIQIHLNDFNMQYFVYYVLL